MKGYKGMNADMTCRGMQYELGKTYHIDGNIKLCNRGFHFCEKLKDVFDYYGNDGTNRFFEIVADGDIESNGSKSAAHTITIVRELSAKEVNKIKYGDGYGNGNGHGYGNGNGDGNGDGDGYGDGYGYGDGDGYGYGYGIQKILNFN